MVGVGPLRNDPRPPVDRLDREGPLGAQGAFQAADALDLIHEHRSLFAVRTEPYRVDGLPCVTSKFRGLRLFLVVGGAGGRIGEQGVGVVEDDGHVVALRAGDVRVAPLLEGAVGELDLGGGG